MGFTKPSVPRVEPAQVYDLTYLGVRTTAQLEEHNANYIGGDLTTGAKTARQLIFRPRVTLNPYGLGVAGVYLYSAATPPGAGAHGMCGYNAARAALASLR